MARSSKSRGHIKPTNQHRSSPKRVIFTIGMVGIIVVVVIARVFNPRHYSRPLTVSQPEKKVPPTTNNVSPKDIWLQRSYAVDALFHDVYTPCWEGAYGAIGDAYLFAATGDSSLLRFHLVDHDLRNMCPGTWVDDRAWVCLAEMIWWKLTDKKYGQLVEDAIHRYDEARMQGRLSHFEGYWSWYNYPPSLHSNQKIFTNSAMNQMATVACRLYEATGEQRFLDDALLVWNGDKTYSGIQQQLYKGNGKWEGKNGVVAFGKELGWEGSEYCSLGAMLFTITHNQKYKKITILTAQRVMNPDTGWVDRDDYFQIRMDGNGAFVNYLLDAYAIAPDDLHDIPDKIEKMLEHVWTNHHGMATVTLHRESDNGIRNGWNPNGGEQGYGVDEVGTVHGQGEAARAFGMFAYFKKQLQR